MKFISSKVHTIIGLIVGALLVAAPFILGFSDDNSAATIVPIVIGLFIILNELVTTSPSSLVKLVPMRIHIILDVLTGVVLALSPWLFGFMDTNNPIQWVPHVVVGIMVVGYALFTSTDDAGKTSIAA